MNIKQTNLLEYIVNKFNENSFGVPFRMGTYGLDDDDQGLVIYAPTRDNNGDFDRIETFDEETYQTGEKTFVVMSGQMGSGEYVALPNIQMATYDVMCEFLVYIDNPISEIIRMAIEEIRDGFIGNIDTLTVNEVDLEDETTDASLNEVVLKLVTNADGLDFGSVINIKGRKYLNYSLTISMNVSKNVDFGNQVKWCIYEVLTEEDCVEPTESATVDDVGEDVVADDGSTWTGAVDTEATFMWIVDGSPSEPYDYTVDSVGELPTPTTSGLKAKVNGPVVTKQWVFLGYALGLQQDYTVTGSVDDPATFLINAEADTPASTAEIGEIIRQNVFDDAEYYYAEVQDVVEDDLYYISALDDPATYEWEFVSAPTTCNSFIPLIASWSTNQDVEAFQTLRPYVTATEATINRAKEVHNYVKSRGFGTAFTFLLDTTDDTIKDLFIQTFKQQDEPPIYQLKMQMQTLNALGVFADDTDLTFERTMIYGEAQVGDISYGEPIIFAIGFIPSAKDE